MFTAPLLPGDLLHKVPVSSGEPLHGPVEKEMVQQANL